MLFQLKKNTALLYTKGLLAMLCAFVMVGYLRVFHPNAFVAMDLMLTML